MRNSRVQLLGVLGLLAAMAGALAQAPSREGQPREDQPRAPRAYLGVMMQPADDGQAGLAIRSVAPDSPAAKAGLKNGDMIVKVGDTAVKDLDSFSQVLARRKPGDKVSLQIMRDGKEQLVSVTLGERPDRVPGGLGPFGEGGDDRPGQFPRLPGGFRPARGAYLGIEMQDLTDELRKRLNIEVEKGVLVAEVAAESPAAHSGLKRDDVITAVDGRAVADSRELREAIQRAGAGKIAIVSIMRGKEKSDVKVKLAEGPAGFGGGPGLGLPRGPMPPDFSGIPGFGEGPKVRELERRIEELEKRLQELEKRSKP